jgi:hypothetical protein
MRALQEKARSFVREQSNDLTPLCFAMQELSGIVKKRKMGQTTATKISNFVQKLVDFD